MDPNKELVEVYKNINKVLDLIKTLSQRVDLLALRVSQLEAAMFPFPDPAYPLKQDEPEQKKD